MAFRHAQISQDFQNFTENVPRSRIYTGGPCYAVARGKTPGIYQTWAEAEIQVKGFSDARFKKFSTAREAEMFMAENSKASDKKPQGSPYYAVARGKKPGIYRTWPEAETQVENVFDARFKKFETLEEAQMFMTENSAAARSAPTRAIQVSGQMIVPTGPDLVAFTDGACANNGQRGARAAYAAIWPDDSVYGKIYIIFI